METQKLKKENLAKYEQEKNCLLKMKTKNTSQICLVKEMQVCLHSNYIC